MGRSVKCVYLDASFIIYLVEADSPFHEVAKQRLLAHQGEAETITSRLSRLECRVKPLRDNDQQLLALFDAFYTKRHFRMLDITAALIESATDLRARYGLKTPDALHTATALQERADLVLTGDAGFARCTEIKVDVVTQEK